MSGKIRLMGILNVTPDSFYDSGKFYDEKIAIDRAYEIADEGADIIDIGGESTRPGANPVPASEEIDRVCPVIEAISKDIGISISIDTNKSDVAEAALRSGATIVNDISGLTFDGEMAAAVAKHNAGVILMHIQGKPGDMQDKIDPYLRPLYDSLYMMMDGDKVERFLEGNIIEVAPIAFMRGRTLSDSFIILDEAQNATSEQMKMFLTRIGLNSKTVVTGDITQIDLPKGQMSGLVEVGNILKNIEGISFCYFDHRDVVRHRLVKLIIQAYQKA